MTIKKLMQRLQAAGLDAEPVTLGGPHSRPRPGIRVKHNYRGYYPPADAYAASIAAQRIATAAGYHAEPRGAYTSTFIF